MTHLARWTARLASLALLLSLAACAPPPGAAPSRFSASALQPGDSVTFDDSTANVTIDITSVQGIGKAEIQRSGPPPKTLTINFHLKGLEELKFGWASTTVLIHVASSDGSVSEELSLNGGQPSSIDSTSPYWTPVHIVAEDPKIPLQSGFFAVTAPPAFLQAAPQRFSLQWIDFYR